MIRIKLYRWFSMFFGHRSFVMQNGKKTTYVLIKGHSDRIVNQLISSGFVEEWPRNTTKEQTNG